MNKYIFLDRDGTIIVDKKYIHKIQDLEILPQAIEGLKKMQALGFQLIIVSNQAGIARSYYTEKQAEHFNRALVRQLRKEEIKIEKVYICPHHPEFSGVCECRKPNLGMVEKASAEFNIDLSKSVFIGDKDCDVELGKRCGGTTFWVNNGQYETTVIADFIVKNLEEAADKLNELKI